MTIIILTWFLLTAFLLISLSNIEGIRKHKIRTLTLAEKLENERDHYWKPTLADLEKTLAETLQAIDQRQMHPDDYRDKYNIGTKGKAR